MCGVGIFPLSRPSANPQENGLNPTPPGVLDVTRVGRDLQECKSFQPYPRSEPCIPPHAALLCSQLCPAPCRGHFKGSSI